MKIGIITYHRAENYGSVLQAYALNKALRGLDCSFEVETIDYQNKAQAELYRIFQPVKSLMDGARFLLNVRYYKSLKRKKQRFDSFIKDNIPLSEFHGDNREELAKYARQYAYAICGSDQIWNVQTYDYDPSYMLDFVLPPTRKVSYAPSLSVNNFTAEEKQLYKRYIQDYVGLSVREEEGIQVLDNIIGIKPQRVLDPVFLLTAEEWRKLANNPLKGKKYILCYFIGDCQGMRAYARQMSKEKGLPVVMLLANLREIKTSFICQYDAGPKEFLGLIDGAEYIVTNSFHAVSFSLILHKDFFVFTKAENPNSRLVNITMCSGTRQRLISVETMRCVDTTPIDFATADRALSVLRSESVSFLKKTLK